MKTTARRILIGLCLALTTFALLAVAQQQMPRTTKQTTVGNATVKTEELRGTVIQVDGGTLVFRLPSGEIRTAQPPADRKFIIDGKETPLSELKPGTKLHATMTTTTTPVTDRTTTVGTGKVWFVSGNTVILTLPNNENRVYKVAKDYKFTVEGKKADVSSLKKGMIVAAEKIVEEPRTEITSTTAITGEAPPPPAPKTEVAAAPAPRPRPAPAPAPVAAAPAPAPAPAPEPAPAKLPKTGSPLPLIGLAGLLSTAASLALRKMRG